MAYADVASSHAIATFAAINNPTITPGVAATNGNNAYLIIMIESGTETISSVTQTGATWAQLSRLVVNSARVLELWHNANISGSPTGAITVNKSGTNRGCLWYNEVSGMGGTSTLDKTATNFNATAQNTPWANGTTAANTQNVEYALAAWWMTAVESSGSVDQSFTIRDTANFQTGTGKSANVRFFAIATKYPTANNGATNTVSYSKTSGNAAYYAGIWTVYGAQSTTVSVTDTEDISLTETSTNVISSSNVDTDAVSLSEVSSTTAIFSTTETCATSLGEVSSVTAIISVSDTVSVSLSEADTTQAGINTSNQLDVSLSEISANFLTINVTDQLDIAALEGGNDFITSRTGGDTATITLTEVSSVVTAISTADTLNIAEINDLPNVYEINNFNLADTLNVSLVETSIQPVPSSYTVTDMDSVSLTESSSVKAIISRTDSLGISFTDVSLLSIPISVVDSLGIALTETSKLVKTISVTDTLGVALGEVSTLIVSAQYKAVNDTLGVQLIEASSNLIKSVQTDTVSTQLIETSALSVIRTTQDALNITTTNQITLGPSAFNVTDAVKITLQEKRPTIAGQTSVTEQLNVALAETSSTLVSPAFKNATESCNLALTEQSAVFVWLSVADSLAVTASEATQTRKAFSVYDEIATGLSETSQSAIASQLSEKFRVVMSDLASLRVQSQNSDSLSVQVSEAVALRGLSNLIDTGGVAILEQTTLVQTNAQGVATCEATDSAYATGKVKDSQVASAEAFDTAVTIDETTNQEAM